ncbi:hypothetical protein [Mesorhizobium salmacidum]|uniref:hypothetical protein n=1 Tax=Mesorhizobium salmacidum TaxID=3015171 RepID=UPI00301DF023
MAAVRQSSDVIPSAYACCFINVAVLIANYNVDHSLEMTGQVIPLDAWYLRSPGPGAFPALENRRSWNFRDWRLLRYLDSKGSLVLPQPSQPSLPDR